jgi:hypothetical protein
MGYRSSVSQVLEVVLDLGTLLDWRISVGPEGGVTLLAVVPRSTHRRDAASGVRTAGEVDRGPPRSFFSLVYP